jgi:hypothetical protein
MQGSTSIYTALLDYAKEKQKDTFIQLEWSPAMSLMNG